MKNKKMIPNEKDVISSALSDNPWKSKDNVIWLGSTFSLRRNIEKVLFPHKLALEKKQHIRDLLVQTLLKNKEFSHAFPLLSEQLSPIDRELIGEQFLLQFNLQPTSGIEAFIIGQKGSSLAIINLEDHLHLMIIDASGELSKGWDRLLDLELDIAKSINFSFSQKFGYLTSDPAICGTTLSVTLFLHLPALLSRHKPYDSFIQNNEINIIQTGLQGNPNEFIGDLVTLHNGYTFGVSENHILSTLQTIAAKLSAEERSIRSEFKRGPESEVAEIKDKMSRAYALLMHSYQIEVVEAMNALSWVKLGLDLEWLKGVSHAKLNHLFFTLRHAHLSRHFEHKFSQEELPHQRAAFVHTSLKDLELLI